MAKAVITIKDKGKRGEINVVVEFDPPLEKGKKATTAQLAAAACIEAIRPSEEDE